MSDLIPTIAGTTSAMMIAIAGTVGTFEQGVLAGVVVIAGWLTFIAFEVHRR